MESHEREPLTLPEEIRAATRSHHTSLNRLITSRLDLCLPPHAQDSTIYFSGIREFAELFFSFERELESIASPSESPSVYPTRIREVVRPLCIPSLLRTRRLRSDLALLAPDARLPPNEETPALSIDISHRVSSRIQQKPHILAAYSWILYLALFNGGRWIRSRLLAADFYPTDHIAEDYLSFWSFDGDFDGDDIKDTFKAQFGEVAKRLTREERSDVIEEAIEIFKMCEMIVGRLDERFTTTTAARKLEGTRFSLSPYLTGLSALLLPSINGINVIFGWVWALVLGSFDVAMPRKFTTTNGIALGSQATNPS